MNGLNNRIVESEPVFRVPLFLQFGQPLHPPVVAIHLWPSFFSIRIVDIAMPSLIAPINSCIKRITHCPDICICILCGLFIIALPPQYRTGKHRIFALFSCQCSGSRINRSDAFHAIILQESDRGREARISSDVAEYGKRFANAFEIPNGKGCTSSYYVVVSHASLTCKVVAGNCVKLYVVDVGKYCC
jgi:hypothetical protein